jgi:hypothetical protein
VSEVLAPGNEATLEPHASMNSTSEVIATSSPTAMGCVTEVWGNGGTNRNTTVPTFSQHLRSPDSEPLQECGGFRRRRSG